jgi:predicted DNA-binding transcriptional regulator YafY
MALDRIKAIEETETQYIDTDVNWEDYFYDLIGVTKKVDEKVIELKLWFHPSQAPYVITKPIHPSQPPLHKLKNTEDGLEITISVIPNYELEKLILSFGETVKVLSPKSFQIKILERIKSSIKLYYNQ